MGVDVVVAVYGGNPRRTKRRDRDLQYIGVYNDTHEWFEDACDGTELPMLSRINQVGSLVLSREDMPQFMQEMWSLAGGQSPPYLEPILELAELCARTEGSELRLDGD